MNLALLGLQLDSPLARPGARNFRPPSWPPPADWAPVVDAEGNAQCVYSDSTWPLDVWAGSPLKLNFGDGPTKGARIDAENANLLRQCAVWFLWGTNGCREASTFSFKVSTLKPLFVACSRHGIVATDLTRFEAVLDQVAESLPRSSYGHVITMLHELLDAREQLGLCLLDRDGISRLARYAPTHTPRQTPYIPPRIWTYQVSRLHECLEAYHKKRHLVEACFRFCVEAYAHNFGSLKKAMNETMIGGVCAPFQNKKSKRFTYLGPFKLTADKFGVTELIEAWVAPFTGLKGEMQLPKFSQYLDLVSKAALAYMINFSLMRVEEAWDLRSDCLKIERDEKFGDIYMLSGETTKTEKDSDARWPVSKSVQLAIDVLRHIASLRMLCARERDGIGLTPEDVANPYLNSYQYEPWSKGRSKSYRTRPIPWNYQQVLDYFPQFLDTNQITVNEEDLRIARLLTPSLDEKVYKVGQPWKIAWHQLRRTGAVNMLSSEMVAESSLQLLLKHHSRVMTLYYGRNHSRLALDQETRTLFLKTMYEELGRDLRKLPSPQFVSPLGADRKDVLVLFIKESDANAIEKAARQGKVGARRIRAGFCVNHRPCPYGGIESIAHCLGGDSGKGCPDLLLDTEKLSDIQLYEGVIDAQLKVVHVDSPRYQSLQAEKRAAARFHEFTETQDRRGQLQSGI